MASTITEPTQRIKEKKEVNEHKGFDELNNLVKEMSELEFTILKAKDDLNKLENKLFTEIMNTRSFEFLNINYRKLRSTMR